MQNITESRNLASQDIDRKSTIEILRIINDEDRKVALAVEREIDAIAMAVDLIVNSFARGGRLVYVGAGTSGRLGILDASECPPTFGTPEQQVVGLIAGGTVALRQAVEGAEDDPRAGEADLRGIDFCGKDVLVGIAASGRTPYVVGAMKHARTTGAGIVALCCNPGSEIAQLADVAIVPVVGPEVIAGSSRMKAGTAQKLVLNMLSTGAMIKTGKVYGDLMVDVKATNSKLIERQTRIVMQATGCSRAEAVAALDECDRHCKTAIVRVLTGTDCRQARRLLDENGGFIRPALNR